MITFRLQKLNLLLILGLVALAGGLTFTAGMVVGVYWTLSNPVLEAFLEEGAGLRVEQATVAANPTPPGGPLSPTPSSAASPATTEPAATGSLGTDPTVAEPATDEPAITGPAPQRPVPTQPVAPEPVAPEPARTEPAPIAVAATSPPPPRPRPVATRPPSAPVQEPAPEKDDPRLAHRDRAEPQVTPPRNEPAPTTNPSMPVAGGEPLVVASAIDAPAPAEPADRPVRRRPPAAALALGPAELPPTREPAFAETETSTVSMSRVSARSKRPEAITADDSRRDVSTSDIETRKARRRVARAQPGIGDAPTAASIYELQLGLFLEEANASEFVDTLSRRGYKAYVVEVLSSKGIPRYTVRLGPFSTKQEAAQMATSYRANEGSVALIRWRPADTPTDFEPS